MVVQVDYRLWSVERETGQERVVKDMGEFFTYFSLTGLVNAIVSLGFALYLTLTSWHVRVAKYLVYLCLTIGAWSTGYFLWQISTTPEQALFWSRGLMAGAIFTSISFLHLVIVFLQLDKKRFYRIMLILFYIPCFIFEIVNFTPLFVSGVGQRLFFQFWPLPGPFLLPQVLLFGLHIILAAGLLYKKYRHSIGDEKKQVLMLLIGVTTTFIGGGTNYFLWFNIPIAPWGNGVALAYAIMSIYAIMRYDFLNLKVVTAELFTGLLVVLSFVDVLLSQESGQLVFNVVKLLLVLVFGYILIKSVHHEIQRREEVTTFAHSLEKAKHQLEEANAERVAAISMAADELQSSPAVTDAINKVASKKNNLTVLNKQHLINFINAFVNMSRLGQKESFHFGTVDINKIMDKIIAMSVKRIAGKTMPVIKWEPMTDIEGLKLDEEKISHAIIILLDNALKYGKGGEIIINTMRQKFGLAVFIVDGGIGFTEEEYDKFFHQPYRGTQAIALNQYGTGLSLCIVRQIVEAHGGEVWAHSRGLGKGSEFGFWVPGEKKYPWD